LRLIDYQTAGPQIFPLGFSMYSNLGLSNELDLFVGILARVQLWIFDRQYNVCTLVWVIEINFAEPQKALRKGIMEKNTLLCFVFIL